MIWTRTKTAHLQAIQAWKKRGITWEAWQAIVARRIKEQLAKPKAALSEEIQRAMTAKEKKRHGWKSAIKDKRL